MTIRFSLTDDTETTAVMLFTEYGGTDLYAFYVANMFDPAVYLVAGESFDDAYENFLVIPRVERELTIDPEDMGDYDADNVRFNDNGVPVDDEAVQGFGPLSAENFR